jgi:hypothetical protein
MPGFAQKGRGPVVGTDEEDVWLVGHGGGIVSNE